MGDTYPLMQKEDPYRSSLVSVDSSLVKREDPYLLKIVSEDSPINAPRNLNRLSIVSDDSPEMQMGASEMKIKGPLPRR
jgi:hypothetical protein